MDPFIVPLLSSQKLRNPKKQETCQVGNRGCISSLKSTLPLPMLPLNSDDDGVDNTDKDVLEIEIGASFRCLGNENGAFELLELDDEQ